MSATHYICPGCGAEIEVGSEGCPKCTRTPKARKKPAPKPWEQDEAHDGLNLDLPDDDTFDYEHFIAEEFGGQPQRSPREWLWWTTALVLLAVMLYVFLR